MKMKSTFFVALTVACLALANSANASVFLAPNANLGPIPGNNDFQSQLNDLGFTNVLSGNIVATADGTATFFVQGSESGLQTASM